MMSRRQLLVLTSVLCVAPSSARALPAAYTATALAEAQALGRPIVVEIFAPWCSTCRAQKDVLDTLTLQQRYWQVIRLVVDFDEQPDVVRSLKATRQGTLIMWKGSFEVGRVVGQSRRDAVEALLNAAL